MMMRLLLVGLGLGLWLSLGLGLGAGGLCCWLGLGLVRARFEAGAGARGWGPRVGLLPGQELVAGQELVLELMMGQNWCWSCMRGRSLWRGDRASCSNTAAASAAYTYQQGDISSIGDGEEDMPGETGSGGKRG